MMDAIFELLLEADVEVEDVKQKMVLSLFILSQQIFHQSFRALRANNGQREFQVTELEMIHKLRLLLKVKTLKFSKDLLMRLEADDDVQKVYHNVADV